MDIVRGVIKNQFAANKLIECLETLIDDGTLYLGYPLRAQDESKTTLDALLLSLEYGIVSFSFENFATLEEIRDYQDSLYYQIEYNFQRYSSLRSGRRLAFEPIIFTFLAETPKKLESDFILTIDDFKEKFTSQKQTVELTLYRKIVAALQKMGQGGSKTKREITSSTSKGYKIQAIEKEIANLDKWQNHAAFEDPEGIQRIRGLAGSGKTVVLAKKAAYLHFQYPEWKIAVTFYTRSLGQQFYDMINMFYKEYSDEPINEDKLQILHAWGAGTEIGVYSEVCHNLGIVPENYNLALQKYGRNREFQGAISGIINLVSDSYTHKYDAILIDEAQDMPANFFQLCYKITKDSHKIVYAYDELQNLNTEQMPSLEEMFGTNEDGTAKISIENRPDQPQSDIVLPVCYRNTKWALTLAHSIGFGIYRDELIQFFNNDELWQDIGYEIVEGSLRAGQIVSLKRKRESSPRYFDELEINPENSIIINKFDSMFDQYEYIAEQIQKNIAEDDLLPEDILVIFPDAYTSKKEYYKLQDSLLKRSISSNLAGVTTDRDTFKEKGYITCSSIYRAKGNESAVVYVVNADYCISGPELIKKRNAIFTAITRSKAWVCITGVGDEMEQLMDEINECRSNNYHLQFKVPTDEQIRKMRRVHRELSHNDHKARKIIDELKKMITSGELNEEYLQELGKFTQYD